jgi:predicted metal-dependent hydrolase
LSSSPNIVKIDEIAVILQRHALAKSVRLRIDPRTQNPIVTAPKFLAIKHIESFLHRHHAWIIKQLAFLSPPIDTDKVLFKGKSYQLITQLTPKKRLTIYFDHLQQSILHNTSTDLIKIRLKPAFKREALTLIQQHCIEFAEKLKISFKEIQIKDYKGRWGSCRQDGVLSFSWRLIMAPPEVLKYVCAHEVAHLIQMNHSPAFWQIVGTLFPLYKQPKAWLKENGNLLFRQL